MASGGEVPGQCPDSSEDLDQLKCQPCLEDGYLRDAVGMCVDCQDYLCLKCYDGHTLPKPTRKHQLIDREQMLYEQIRPTVNDVCTERCSMHEEETIKYYCIDHCMLGCTACITLDHTKCRRFQYIPHVAKDLASTAEYTQIESEPRAALEAFKQISENTQQNTEELNTSCSTALESVRAYRKRVDVAFDKIEAKLIEKAQEIQSKELKQLQAVGDMYKKAQEDLQTSLTKIEALQSAQQNCSSYIEMMRTKDKLMSLDAEINGAEVDKTYRPRLIQFTPNPDILGTLEDPDVLGTLSGSDAIRAEGSDAVHADNRPRGPIVLATHVTDVNVRTVSDTRQCFITGIAVLPDSRLIVADRSNNSIKTISVEGGKVTTQLTLSSQPWDISVISQDKLAVTIPGEKKIAIVAVGDKSLNVDRTLDVGGSCRGVDYRNGKLAVSFYDPHEVQILNPKQGTVLHTISADKQGQTLFNWPYYLTYGQDDTTLYVSNNWGRNVVCVKVDGTHVASYTGTELRHPRAAVIDSTGTVYVCASSTHTVHQISKDCQKQQVLLTQADGLYSPNSMCLSEENDMLYVGMYSDIVKVYTTKRRSQ